MPEPEHISGFATFPNRRSRAVFLRELFARAPELRQHATLAAGRPVAIFEELNANQLVAIHTALAGRGSWSGDVRFQPTGPAKKTEPRTPKIRPT